MHPVDLASCIDRRLAQLPSPRAPGTLLPRVLVEVQRAMQRPWYGRPWVSWPWSYRAASVVTLAALALLVGLAVEWANSGVVRDLAGAAATADDVAALAHAAGVLWRVFLEPTLGYLVVLSGLMCVTAALFCAALSRVLKVGSANQ